MKVSVPIIRCLDGVYLGMNPEEAVTVSHEDAEVILNQCFKYGRNALMVGAHGTGKTSLIQKVASHNGLEQGSSFVYLSGSTLDPWVDFVGVPRPEGDYLKFYRPSYMDPDKVQLLVIDEINRSQAKVRNACMELAQFKTVNGVHFPKLKAVWACANPADQDSGYTDTESIDVALADRFHTIMRLPIEPSKAHFVSRFGDEIGLAAIEWWRFMSSESKKKVSPRRLEYAIDLYMVGMPPEVGMPGVMESTYLKDFLSGDDPLRKIHNYLSKGDIVSLAELVMSHAAMPALQKIAEHDKKTMLSVIDALPAEHCVSSAIRHDQFRKEIGVLYAEWWANEKRHEIPASPTLKVVHSLASLTKSEVHQWAQALVNNSEPGASIPMCKSMNADQFGVAFRQRYCCPAANYSVTSYNIKPWCEELSTELRASFKKIESEARKAEKEESENGFPTDLAEILEDNPSIIVENAKYLRRSLTRWVIPILEREGSCGMIKLRDTRVFRNPKMKIGIGTTVNYNLCTDTGNVPF